MKQPKLYKKHIDYIKVVKDYKNKTRKGTEKRRQEKNWTATRMSGAKT